MLPGLIVLLVVIASSSAWLLNSLQPQSGHAPEIKDLPDYSLSDFVTTKRDEAGQFQYQLQAMEMQHYPISDTQLQQPYLVFYQQGQARWYIRAEKGQVSADGQLIYLPGKTIFWQYDASGQRSLSIYSRDVTLKPDLQYAETYAKVDIISPQGTTTAQGMRVYLDQQRLELNAKVRSIYQP